MATLTATLLSGADPRPVQIALNGATAGQSYQVVGTTAGGSSWRVPGGSGVSAGTQVLLIDNRSALNAVVTYQAVVDGVTVTAAPVTVAYSGDGVLQTIDGLTVVGVLLKELYEPMEHPSRVAAFEVSGRADPAIRLDVPSSAIRSWAFETRGADTPIMRRVLQAGVPVVRRMRPGVRDADAVVIAVVTSWSDALTSDADDTWRTWELRVREISDPQPSTPLIAFTWDDFDAAMADRVWSWHTLFPALTGWAATNGTLSLQTSGGYSTSNFARASATAATTAVDILESAYAAAASTLGSAVTAGDVVTVTARVKGTAGRTVSAAIKWSGGTVVTGTAVTLTGAWQQVSVTGTAPAGTTGLAAGARMAATGVAAGDVLDFSAPTISRGVTVPNGTFDELFTTWDLFDAADWSVL